jgi:hypothetical protein
MQFLGVPKGNMNIEKWKAPTPMDSSKPILRVPMNLVKLFQTVDSSDKTKNSDYYPKIHIEYH